MRTAAGSDVQKNIPGNSKTIYLPGLNGLRAIAAIAVVISHITLSLGEFGLSNTIFGADMHGNPKGLELAEYGVTIFFTLSGFLITFLLLNEKESGKIRIKNFYARRILRIWPLYYLFFAVCIVTILLFEIPFIKSSVPFYIFLAANIPFILNTTLPFLSHYWTLGVEEQFYLFLPHFAKLPDKKLFRIVVLLITAFMVVKFFFWVLLKNYGYELPYLLINVNCFHMMLIGVAAAIQYRYNNKKFIAIATHKVTQLVSWFCILLVAIHKFHIASVIDEELISVVTVFLIIGQITKKNNFINLENKVCDFIGKISYGIYVIHPIIIFYCSKFLRPFTSKNFISYLLVFSLIIALTIILAYISYEFYEKYFLKLKARFTTVKSVAARSGL